MFLLIVAIVLKVHIISCSSFKTYKTVRKILGVMYTYTQKYWSSDVKLHEWPHCRPFFIMDVEIFQFALFPPRPIWKQNINHNYQIRVVKSDLISWWHKRTSHLNKMLTVRCKCQGTRSYSVAGDTKQTKSETAVTWYTKLLATKKFFGLILCRRIKNSEILQFKYSFNGWT